ncbi:restriction endonuclease subunit S [Vibrio cidicii]|uniref:restriction endonuclease subunit S n=1 Tax=Vibrio cidicii TaxID=1763883 RepID=UPI001C9D2A71|nr:restriction endonuclease subunit S [Vibrio fluvialis]
MVPNGWEKSPVGKLCKSIVPGRNKPKVFDGDIPWVTTPEISGKYIPSAKQKNYISQSVAKECGAKIVPKGAVIIAAVGELGLTAIAKEEIILNQQLHAFVCPPNVNNEYLAYFLSAQKPYMDTVASKTTISYMNKSNCESIPVLLPPLPEQRKIAKILSTWDKAITTTERLIAASQQQKKALMQQLLTGKKRLINPETGKVFEGNWEEVKLEKCLSLMRSGLSRKLENENVGIAVIRSNNMGSRFTTHDDLKYWYLNDPQGAKVENYVLNDGDILVNFINSLSQIGKTCIYKKHNEQDAIYTTNLLRLKVNKKIVVSNFLFYLTKTEQYRNAVQSITKPAVNQASFTTKEFGSIKFLIPALSEQQKIASVLTAADKEIELLEAKLAHLKDEKKALMQQLLTGKRRVKVDVMEMA